VGPLILLLQRYLLKGTIILQVLGHIIENSLEIVVSPQEMAVNLLDLEVQKERNSLILRRRPHPVRDYIKPKNWTHLSIKIEDLQLHKSTDKK